MRIKRKLKDLWENFIHHFYYRGIRRLIPSRHDRLITTKEYWSMLADRYKYGFDVSETWSLDYSLTKLIAPRFRMFNKIAGDCGSLPGKFLEDEQNNSLKNGYRWDYKHSRLADKRERKRCWDRAKKAWKNILDKIQAAFDDMELEDKDWDAWNKKWEQQVNRINNKIKRAKTEKEKEKIWNSMKSGCKYRPNIVCCTDDFVWNMRKEGLRLFSEYYESFWW